MSNKKQKNAARTESEKRRTAEVARVQRSRNIRETVESIAIAFILAFLFRTFEAEAFVIPTGSMAPTLQGQHKDVECPKCSFRYQASASSEESPHEADDIVSATCPMCRYRMSVDPTPPPAIASDPEVIAGAATTTYNGDRILVGKFIYELSEPERWDVIVFKYPGEAKMNYIKRLIGLPGEELVLQGGDVFVRPRQSDEPLEIARKPPEKLEAMVQVVHDNDFLPAEYVHSNWPLRWHIWPPRKAAEAGGWDESREIVERDGAEVVEQRFRTSGTADEPQWIRYQHFVPSPQDWAAMQRGPLPPNYPIRPQLISDFYAYNTSLTRREAYYGARDDSIASKFGLHWVGDLMLQCNLRVESEQGKILLDLVEGGRHYTATLDLATGEAVLSADGLPDFAPGAQTPIIGPGTYQLALSNADDQLLLWIDGEPVSFDAPTTYPHPETTVPTTEDLAPAGLGVQGAAVEVLDLRVLRDIYYIADLAVNHEGREYLTDYPPRSIPLQALSRARLAGFLASPESWQVFGERRRVKYELGPDQFFVLGDNSPFSKDSRLWASETYNGRPLNYYVDRELLIGKALFIYWPHSWDRLPGTNVPFPFFPNFQDMGLVR